MRIYKKNLRHSFTQLPVAVQDLLTRYSCMLVGGTILRTLRQAPASDYDIVFFGPQAVRAWTEAAQALQDSFGMMPMSKKPVFEKGKATPQSSEDVYDGALRAALRAKGDDDGEPTEIYDGSFRAICQNPTTTTVVDLVTRSEWEDLRASEVLSTFDLSVSQVGWDGVELVCTDEFVLSMTSNRIQILNPQKTTSERVLKYSKLFGFLPPAESEE